MKNFKRKVFKTQIHKHCLKYRTRATITLNTKEKKPKIKKANPLQLQATKIYKVRAQKIIAIKTVRKSQIKLFAQN
jgi:hypothetical protein